MCVPLGSGVGLSMLAEFDTFVHGMMTTNAVRIFSIVVAASLFTSLHAVPRNLGVPPEVIVSSHATVSGSERDGRVLSVANSPGTQTMGSDGIPVVNGVRVRETEAQRNEPVWRNARVIGGQLFPNDQDPATVFHRTSGVATLKQGAKVAKSLRQGRILSHSVEEKNIPLYKRLSTLPPHYYRDYYKSEQEKSSPSDSFSPMVGITVLDKSPSSLESNEILDSSNVIRVVKPKRKTQKEYKAYSDAQLSTQAKHTYTKSVSGVVNRVATAATTVRPINHHKDSRKHFKHRVHQVQSHGQVRFPSDNTHSKDGHILSPGSYQLPSAAAQFQDSVDPFSGRPVDPNQFKIKQMAFQSVPGGPIVNIPVPIPHKQQPKPIRRFSWMEAFGLDRLFGGNRRADAFPSQQQSSSSLLAGSNGYTEYEYESPSLYDTLTSPIRRIGEAVLEMIRPLRSPALALEDYPQQLDNKQGTVADPGEALLVGGLVVGAGVMASVGSLLYANTVTNDTHYIIGRRRRSLSDLDGDDMVETILRQLDASQQLFLGQIQEHGLDKWTSKECAKRIYCEFMMSREPQLRQELSDRVTSFLSYLDDGSEDGWMKQARLLHSSLSSGSCRQFACSGHSTSGTPTALPL